MCASGGHMKRDRTFVICCNKEVSFVCTDPQLEAKEKIPLPLNVTFKVINSEMGLEQTRCSLPDALNSNYSQSSSHKLTDADSSIFISGVSKRHDHITPCDSSFHISEETSDLTPVFSFGGVTRNFRHTNFNNLRRFEHKIFRLKELSNSPLSFNHSGEAIALRADDSGHQGALKSKSVPAMFDDEWETDSGPEPSVTSKTNKVKNNRKDQKKTFWRKNTICGLKKPSNKIVWPISEVALDQVRAENRRETFTVPAEKRLLQVVAEPQVALQPMSFQTNLLASKESFTLAKFAKSVSHRPFQNKRVFVPKLQDKSKEAAWRKMGNTNVRRVPLRVPLRGELPSPPLPEDPYVKRSQQRRRNGQREVHKSVWRAEKRGLAAESAGQGNVSERPKIPKRATYKKAKSTQPPELGEKNAANSSSEVRVVQASVVNPLASSLPSRSEVLPPDGDSLRSHAERLASAPEYLSKCQACVEYQARLSKAYAQKGAVVVTMEKAQRELALSQKRVKDLEQDVQELRRSNDDALSSIKDLESEMCQLQKDKALYLHELNVTRRQLTRALEQSDVSDCSHVSSIYVSGSQKTLDDGLGEDVSPDDEDYEEEQCRKMKESLALAHVELDRLRAIEIRKEELEAAVAEYEDRISQLQEKLQEFVKPDCKHASTQTFSRDGTFTRQQDRTKIPKRLIGHHSSLPVINDPPNLCRMRAATSSLSRLETLQKNLKVKENEIVTLKNEMSELEKELEKQKHQEELLQDSEFVRLKAENERLHKELRLVTENYHKEMIMRKKYFNIAEDLKGKIRVYCRIRPCEESHRNSVLEVPDEYTVQLKTQRAKYEFTFDGVFSGEHTQTDVFSDVQNLIQSALDGYNVCIFAYGQTGSGKTYTLAGSDSDPGVGPRAFQRIFELVQENSAELNFRICASIFELYNDQLIDLLKNANEEKLKIRRDHYGLVFVQGSEAREVHNEAQLLHLFREACTNRHTGSTRMNTESSRSHLIVTILIESTNKITGMVVRGKLSIVDLAGSERTGKTAVVANQLKEANSINKSLSALGDVIAALSSEQPYVPYRNNKLTLLMQDSLGSNAKTLMFVTISSSEHNVEESLNSLTYASRVKQITNSAMRMAESKEISRLRSIIMKMSREEKHTKFLLT